MKTKKMVFALLSALVLFGMTSPAEARGWDRGRHNGWRPYERPVVVREYRRYREPCRFRERRADFFPTWRTYGDPGWSVNFDSSGDFGFSYGW
jgi:hypothetical protein